MFCFTVPENTHGSWDAYATFPRTDIKPDFAGNSPRTAWRSDPYIEKENIDNENDDSDDSDNDEIGTWSIDNHKNYQKYSISYLSWPNRAYDSQQFSGFYRTCDVVQCVLLCYITPFGCHSIYCYSTILWIHVIKNK